MVTKSKYANLAAFTGRSELDFGHFKMSKFEYTPGL